MYNLLKDARLIQNSDLCLYDSLDAYSTHFNTNGDVDGWDVYYNVYLYGCWNGVLFGSSFDRECYISRSNPFVPIDGSDFYYIKILMKIDVYDENKKPTTAKLKWLRVDDSTWDSNKEITFDIIADDKWHLYTINVGPEQYWQGAINNLRFYPFINGQYRDKFAISYIKISSLNKYACGNTQCDYYQKYSHPCKGAGSRGYCEAAQSKEYYTVISGVNDELILDINDYGPVTFNLGTNENLKGIDIAKVISREISSFNIGAYAYSYCEYTEDNKLRIVSGSKGSHSVVSVSGTAASELGFNKYMKEYGSDPASGFDFASSRLLTSSEINKLVDGVYDDFAYIHSSNQFAVEGGRRDFNKITPSQLLGELYNGYYPSFNNKNKTLIDLSHPINSNGRLNKIYVAGIATTKSKIKIIRPLNDGSFKVIYTLNFPSIDNNYLYTTKPNVYRIDCDILVEKGDVIGVYDVDLYVGVTATNLPDATFFQVNGEVNDIFNKSSDFYSFGIGGFAIYCRSDRRQTNTVLDIDIGERVNVETLDIFGKEESEWFEYNVASCLDVSWDVNLFNETHVHYVFEMWSGVYDVVVHNNIAYGLECLDDGIVTADNGYLGTVYTDNGLATHGPHTYFYVNGDAEWLYSYQCDGKHEFCGDYIPDPETEFYERDPVEFTLKFPHDLELDIHKSIIYFKERNNFRHLELSYFLGAYDYTGNTYDPTFRRIPEYTSVALDGIYHYNTEDDPIAPYIFSNPMNDDIQYAHVDHDPINWEVMQAAAGADWLILEHNFDPISCRGFRILTRKHNSTKLTEIEVYSKMYLESSLLDNIRLLFSSYGSVWNEAFFSYKDDNHISAFVGGAPRYFKLEFFSASKFYLNEIAAFLSETLSSDCTDLVLLDEAKNKDINASLPIEIVNTYGKTLDLTVDIPVDVYQTKNIVYWNKLNSIDDINNPEVGPRAYLFKYDDFTIGLNESQIAINVEAYGLKNLIDGKVAYVSYDNSSNWNYYGTLNSGISLDLCTYGYEYYRSSEFEFEPIHTGTYWKLSFNNAIQSAIKDIKVYKDDIELPIESVYYNSEDGIYSQTTYLDYNYNIIDTLYDDDFTGNDGDLPDSTKWSVHISSNGVCRIIDNSLEIYCSSSVEYTYIESVVDFYGDLDVEVDFNFIQENIDSEHTGFEIKIHAENGDYIYSKVTKDNGNRYWLRGGKTDGGTTNWGSGVSYAYYTNGKLRLIRSGNNIVLYLINGDGNIYKLNYQENWNWFNFYTGKAKIILGYYNSGGGYTIPHIDNFKIRYGIISAGVIGFKLRNGDDTPNKIKLLHSNSTDLSLANIYTSMDNRDNYTIAGTNINFLYNNSTYNILFAIDLEKRHSLSIIRNYGSSNYKLLISINTNIAYSNTDTNDIYSVEFDNSDYSDARWVFIKLLVGDGNIRCLRKLGIYPNIQDVFCKGGGYNCEWYPLGKLLTDYSYPQNVALGATVTGTNNYYSVFYPTYAVDGIYTEYRMDRSWGFQKESGVDPYLEIDFGSEYLINRVDLYHGYDTLDSNYMNVDYKFEVSPTISGAFTTVFTVTGNSDFYRKHLFTPVLARRARLVITKYNSQKIYYYNSQTDSYDVFEGSFLREIEVYTAIDTTHINSEDWPIVALNLNDQFNITGHDLINLKTYDSNDNWDNSEEFFMYSDDLFDDPKKVSFTSEGDYKIQYQTNTNTGDLRGANEYIFDTDIYFDEGKFLIEWDSYEANIENEISIRLDGPDILDSYATTLAAGWVHQYGEFNVSTAGFYDVKAIRHISGDEHSSDASWGARNIIIYRPIGLRKWVSVTRDTATNYSYDNDPSKYGKDWLSLIKVYGDDHYSPTEYYWWWSSTVSELSNNSLMVKEDKRSLEINYPSSSGVDIVEFIEGDSFGKDINFSIKDFFTFWWYVEDINKLDISYGYIIFGRYNDLEPIYYGWDISSLNLNSGWNKVRCKFENADFVVPARSDYDPLGDYLYEDLDYRTNDKEFRSIRLVYRGVGQKFKMYLDHFEIERNLFDDEVKFGNGLCLVGDEYLEIPISNVTLEHGTIEFYIKLYSDTTGLDIFNEMSSRVLFTLVNTNNETIGLIIKSANWFEVFAGDMRYDLTILNISTNIVSSKYIFGRDDIVHLALVWSNDGSFTDNKDTIRLYINGDLICASKDEWKVTDTKSAILKLGGAIPQLTGNMDAYGSAIFNNVKIYDYCKTKFNIERVGIDEEELTLANSFIEISEDNINFYKIGSPNLPLIFKEVPAGAKKIIYLRANKRGSFNINDTTASLLVDWTIPV